MDMAPPPPIYPDTVSFSSSTAISAVQCANHMPRSCQITKLLQAFEQEISIILQQNQDTYASSSTYTSATSERVTLLPPL